MATHHSINYLEIPVKDIAASKAFFATCFGWEFVDYGPKYCAITGAGIDAGMFIADTTASTATGSVLMVMYSEALEASRQSVIDHGATIAQDIFDFPGGRRFHFIDPNGNEYAIWSDK